MFEAMNAVKARVHNGRLVLDEPTELPEGTEVVLVALEAGDELDDEERKALHEELIAASDELDNGLSEDAEEVLARLESLA